MSDLRYLIAWADKSCEQVYLVNDADKWPKWAQGQVVIVKWSDWKKIRTALRETTPWARKP